MQRKTQKVTTGHHHHVLHRDAPEAHGPCRPMHPSRRLSVVVRIAVLGAWLGIGTWSLTPAPACAAQGEGEEDECFDFSDYVPDNVSVAGCWECDRDVHWLESLFSWSWKFTLECTSDDGSTITFEVE